jgi:hypothetical protein
LAGHCLDLGHLHGGEPGRPPGPAPVGEPGHAFVGVSAAPAAYGVDGHAVAAGDLRIGVAVRGVAHDPHADDLLVAGGVGVGQGFEPVSFGGGQRDLARAGGGHGRAFAR